MAEKKIAVSIIIISWNTKRLLRHCLESIRDNSSLPSSSYEVIVVDNGSADGSPEVLREEFPWVTLIKNKENLGYGAANNQGLKIARGKFYLLLNSDTLVKKETLPKMISFMEKYPQVGVIGCRLLNINGSIQPSAGRFPDLWTTIIMLFAERWLGGRLVRTSYVQPKEVDWIVGAAMMVRPEVIQKAGLLDEMIFMYMDETEWCYRIKKAGFKIMFYPGAEIVHLGRGSSKTGKKDPILNIYRGLIYFYQKHYPAWQLPVLRLMLKLKALVSLTVGYLTGSRYLKETYVQAFKIA